MSMTRDSCSFINLWTSNKYKLEQNVLLNEINIRVNAYLTIPTKYLNIFYFTIQLCKLL